MIMPGYGEFYVAARVRLFIALSMSLVLAPLLTPLLPPIPGTPIGLVILLLKEMIVGLLIGGIARIMMSAAHVAGTIIATQSSLASAMMLDLSHSGQATPITNFLSFATVILLFATDLHHIMLRALADSYRLFSPGLLPPSQDFMEYAARSVSNAFALATQMAGPNIVVGIIINLAAGMLARLMPALQIFYLIMVPQILGSFFVLMAIFSGMMLWYMRNFEEAFSAFILLR